MSQEVNVEMAKKKRLKVAGQDLDIDAELAKFEAEERARLGLDEPTKHWVEDMANLTFTKAERAEITLLVGGLTLAHDYLVEGALKGVGYNVQMMDVPNNAAFQTGKEFGNRGQCNPTYFTVGALVQHLITLRDKHGMTAQEIVKKFVFLTAGACGPCRFGMYVTEYRKALRDAGFDGFRVVLFQQTGGMKQATGDESGLELTPPFFLALVKALFTGDVLNALGYRIRPYEVNPGDTNRALEQCKKILYAALENQTNILLAVWKCKPILAAVKVKRTLPKPKVSIIGEFWAMTTEGDGNYQLQAFLEEEGAEADIQLVAAWVLYMLWEARHDTLDRQNLRNADHSKYGLGGLDGFGIGKKLLMVQAGDTLVRAIFQTFAHTMGLYGYKLPDMDAIATVAHQYYNNDLRGGEGHMEVGKLILNATHKKAHMTLSVKPFGCMPSAGVSDGVQSAIIEKFPSTIYCPVETSGDGRVNFYSRVQMYLFKAKQAAAAEYAQALEEHGVTKPQVEAFLEANPSFASALHKAPHVYNGNAADLVAEVAPYITMTRAQRWRARIASLATASRTAVKKSPELVIQLVRRAVEEAPETARKLKEDVVLLREIRSAKRSTPPAQVLDAAAEE
ncbi:MAG TPA: 2-hydroxyglutaryl-CoA dehydratase [Polyangiaceae bacterium]|nr:2-hydroxyglutaryl-CoA dehydratase [Polyangiaceae bacterium]